MIELVIFDCDGVLVDSEPVANRVFGEMIRGLGWSLTPDESSQLFVGRSMPECVRIVEERLGRPTPPDLLAQYHERLCAAYERELTAVPGVAEVVRRLRVPSCVASNGDREKILAALTQVGLAGPFGARVFSGMDVPRPKPFPDVYLAAAAALGAAPQQCLVIEDSLIGATAALRAGMRTYGYAPQRDGAATEDGAALRKLGITVFSRMSELFELLPAEVFHAPAAPGTVEHSSALPPAAAVEASGTAPAPQSGLAASSISAARTAKDHG
jgi:HAD superfamily hydrolase (TIGR01509 family)